MFGLEWGDVDFNGCFLEVRRSIVKGRVEIPKNGKTRRVDMSKQLTGTLKELRTQRKRETLSKGWAKVPDRVFVTGKGCTVNTDTSVPEYFSRYLKRQDFAKPGYMTCAHLCIAFDPTGVSHLRMFGTSWDTIQSR